MMTMMMIAHNVQKKTMMRMMIQPNSKRMFTSILLLPKARTKTTIAQSASSTAAPPPAPWIHNHHTHQKHQYKNNIMFFKDTSKQSYSTTTIVSSSTTSNNDNNNSSSPSPSCTVIQGPSLLQTSSMARPSPTLMILPGLRSLPFWTSPDYSRIAYGDPLVSKVIQHLESNVDMIRNEFINATTTEKEEGEQKLKSDYETTGHADKLHSGQWEWYSYMNKGSVQGHFAYHFPQTSKVLQELRNEHILFEGTPFGFSFFSVLHANSKIQSHTAPMNLRLRIHLPLIVPNNNNNKENEEEIPCGIRVGPLARPWVQDKALVLDDAYNHEVWNNTNQKRVLLLVDIWHPDISLGEKQEIVEMFQNARQQGLWKR